MFLYVLQVHACGVLLTGGKTYCIKKRTCTEHIQAESVLLSDDDSQLHRFCQQCGKFEPLNKFDGTKRCVMHRSAPTELPVHVCLHGCSAQLPGNFLCSKKWPWMVVTEAAAKQWADMAYTVTFADCIPQQLYFAACASYMQELPRQAGQEAQWHTGDAAEKGLQGN